MPYLMEVLTGEQIAALDPFCGAGVRLPIEGLAQEEAGLKLTEIFDTAPHVVSPFCAWLDSRALPEGLAREAVQVIWRERALPGQRDGGDGDQ